MAESLHGCTSRRRTSAGRAPRVDAVLDLEVGVARELTELYAGEKLDWQAAGCLIDFPDGIIHGYLTTPNVGESDRAKWKRRISKALRDAGLVAT